MSLFSLLSRAAAVVVAAAGLVSCGPGVGDRAEIMESRPRVESDEAWKVGATPAERFGAPAADAENPFRWETPDGWTELAASQMRVINFQFGPGGEGECYLTALPGGGGGVVANVNRWCTQLGLEPFGPDEIAALPEKTLLGAPATYVDLKGAFKGMGDAEAREGYRLVGLIQENSGFTFFVKMTGPEATVEANLDAFGQFVSSLELRGRG